MTGPVVVYSERLGPISDVEMSLSDAVGADVRVRPLWSPEEIVTHAADAVAIFVGAVEPFDRSVLTQLPDCLVIARSGVGVNNIDLDAATELGIAVTVVPDASVAEVSDHALALLLTIERRVLDLDGLVRRHHGSPDAKVLSEVRSGLRRLSDLTLGIVGFGRIGRELARKAHSIFGRVVAHDPYQPPERVAGGVEQVDFETLLEQSDLVSIHVPLTETTRHLFGAPEFARMKPGAVLVNTSRGGVVDTAALIESIESGHFGGAGLDVTEREPIPAEDPILRCERVVLTGHSAAFSAASKLQARRSATQAVLLALKGELPEHLANPAVVDSPRFRIGKQHPTD